MTLTTMVGPRRATGVTAADATRVASGRVAAFTKRGQPEAIVREAEILAHVHLLTRGDVALVPAPLAWDRREGRLIVEALDGMSSLHELFASNDRRDTVLARSLGTSLARLHALDPGTFGPAVDYLPRLELNPREAAELPGAILELIGLLQRAHGLEEALDELGAAGASHGVLVHGDLKLDNALADADDAVRLVDFEHAGTGDPAWDLGAAAGDYLSRWLLSVRASASEGLAAWLRAATIPLPRCAVATRATLAAYELERPLPDRNRIAANAGVFLLHRAQAWVERYGVLSAKPTLLARLGARLAVGRWALLGRLLEEPRDHIAA